MLSVNSRAPDFELEGSDGKKHRLGDFSGKFLVLYFYPKDDTAGCTMEAKGFNSKLKAFSELGAVVVGVSGDDFKSHCSFAAKYGLNFLLLSDPTYATSIAYESYGNKGMFGMGIFRTTYVIDAKGKIIEIFKKVSPAGHEDQILTFIENYKNFG